MQMHGCVLSTVATEGLVPQHQALSSYNADQISITLDKFKTKISYS